MQALRFEPMQVFRIMQFGLEKISTQDWRIGSEDNKQRKIGTQSLPVVCIQLIYQECISSRIRDEKSTGLSAPNRAINMQA